MPNLFSPFILFLAMTHFFSLTRSLTRSLIRSLTRPLTRSQPYADSSSP
jgi:hypothetical protein